MLLKGGVQEQQPIQGGTSKSVSMPSSNNTGSTTNSLGGGGTPWGMIAQAIENKRDRTSQQLMNLGNNFTNLAMAAASWNPNFNPQISQGYQPQNMQVQPQSNLYSYLMQ